MKRVLIVNLGVLLILFLTAAVIADPDDDCKAVKKLINKRTEILNDYYGGAIDFDEAENRLEKIEKSAILREDLRVMKMYGETDFDRVTDAEIVMKTCDRNSHGILSGRTQIRWQMQTMEKSERVWTEEKIYFFTGEDNDKSVKLTQLEIL